MTLLVLKDLRAGYGASDIVHGVNLELVPGKMIALVGPNGAGKSTLLKSIAGVANVTGGVLELDGKNLIPLQPSGRAQAGAVFMPQERNVFRTLSVSENLAVSAWGCRDIAARRDEVLTLLPTIRDYLRKRAGGLSGGQRQMVGLGMALMSRPRVLLVDEPTAGLSPLLVGEMLDTLRQLAASANLGILIVEQNARAALQRADRALVLVDGRVVRQGDAAALADEPDFGALFFGEAA
ncbi:ABC transporter ATP-binding protein [Bradyrhizobium diversitatis]|uniref:ABC transporter ATP-binding protein n=1 Tax=Bradyrhizobium diversitatis TaxID=2755406 RepID=A0ABS0NUQ2_9BRAD|nr:ABC transporter ATP-binding protein [Bradyrhizobium diversitatis]MBH5384742.1 ABC transporter ATP-binding protein [Bradyrhizobium diversitatis]